MGPVTLCIADMCLHDGWEGFSTHNVRPQPAPAKLVSQLVLARLVPCALDSPAACVRRQRLQRRWLDFCDHANSQAVVCQRSIIAQVHVLLLLFCTLACCCSITRNASFCRVTMRQRTRQFPSSLQSTRQPNRGQAAEILNAGHMG